MSVQSLMYSVNVMRKEGKDDYDVQDRALNAGKEKIPQAALQMLDNLAANFAKQNAEIDQARVQVVFSANKVEFKGKPNFQKSFQELFERQMPQFNMQFRAPLSLIFVMNVMHKMQEDDLYLGTLPTNTKCTGGGATTGSLRFPHMLDAIYKSIRAGTIRSDQNTNICIVGTGIVKGKNLTTTIPSVAELYALFPEAHFLFLDNDLVIVQALQEQLRMGVLFYDPTALKMRLKGGNALVNDARYSACFKTIRDAMVAAARKPQDAEKVFDESEKSKTLALKVNKEQIEVRNFDVILRDSFNDTDCLFDVIVATNSLSLALFNSIEKGEKLCSIILTVFLNILIQLKEGGILYVDCNMVNLLAIACEKEDNIVSEIEATVGIKVRMERIKIKDFIPTTLEETATIASPMQNRNDLVVSTSDIVAFVREK